MRLSHAGHHVPRQRKRQGSDKGLCIVKIVFPLHYAASMEVGGRMVEGF